MKTTYKSIPVIASVIGSVTRKAMYIVQPTSLDGSKIYHDTWIPVSWNGTETRELRYTNKRYGIINKLLVPSTYHRFEEHGQLLITKNGPIDEYGNYIHIEGVHTVTTPIKQKIEWEVHNHDELIEFDMKRATPSMMYDHKDVVRRVVDGKPKSYLQLQQRILLHIPIWMITPRTVQKEGKTTTSEPIIKVRLSKPQKQEADEQLFNDDEFYGVTESRCMASLDQDYIQDRPHATAGLMFGDTELTSIQQWELENPEYISYS